MNEAQPLLSWVSALVLKLSGPIRRARLMSQSPRRGPAPGTHTRTDLGLCFHMRAHQ